MFILLFIFLGLFILQTEQTQSYCLGSFANRNTTCDKFQFNQLKESAQCTDSNRKTEGIFHGIELSNCTTFYNIRQLPDQNIDEHATKMAQLITNVFENGNTVIGYAAIEKLGDCRGYTCGYIGFTTGTNDAYAVVKEYVNRSPNATIKQYLPELKRLSQFLFGDPERDNTSNLTGFMEAWKTASCQDPEFDQTQLDVGHSMYLEPALKYAASVGVHTNLGKAIFYDTIVQHGWQYVEPMINLPRIIELTGPRNSNEAEQSYLTRFLTTRRQLVCCYPSSVWNDSADRMQDLQSLVDDWLRNKDLNHPITLKIFQATITGKEDISRDTKRCPKDQVTTKKPKSVSLPLPDICP